MEGPIVAKKKARQDYGKAAYRRSEWHVFRDYIIERDGGRCTGQDCGRGREDGVVLQVHHGEYVQGRKPWEYPYEQCWTLCRGCHAREHGLIRPAHGWVYMMEYDRGDVDGKCEDCGRSLRFEHLIDHPSWYAMIVGCKCAERLTGTTEASDAEKELRRRDRRLKTFVNSPKWNCDELGWPNYRDGLFEIEILKDENGFYPRLNDVPERTKRFDEIDELKARVFDFIESGLAEKYLREKGRWKGP